MSGNGEYARNGQAVQYLASQTAMDSSEKKLNRGYFAIPFIFLFVITCAGFIAFLYYLDVRLNNEIRNFNDRIDREMKNYGDRINVKLEEYESQIKSLTTQIDELRDKSSKTAPIGEIMKFKGVTIENIEEFPEIEDIDTRGLVNLAENRKNKQTDQKNPSKKSNITNSPSDDLIDHFQKKKLALQRNMSLPTAPPPPPPPPPQDIMNDDVDQDPRDVGDDDEDEGSDEEGDDLDTRPSNVLTRRRKRSAELANSGGFNLIDTSPEEFDRRNRSNQTAEIRQTSSSQNETAARIDKFQCNSTPCEEARKIPLLQKIANRRPLQMKKATSTRDASSSAVEAEDENIDISETHRTVIAAHFGADSSKYSIQTHSYYDGNYHLRHPTGEYEDWRASSWFDELNMDKHFSLMNGHIKVHSPGLYFVYAQIFYTDRSDVNGYVVYLNSQIVLQCITSTYSLKNVSTKSNTCYTGGVVKCNAGDKISVKTVDPEKRVMLEASRSFVGLFKIGDFQTIK